MNVGQLIKKKRDGEELTKDEIIFLVESMVNGNATESQIGALLMAIYLKGLNDLETVQLTHSMVKSGNQLSWSADWDSSLVDKHSTGGVGDKISLILAPVMAACGLKVPMFSGRSLEHTGGTLDKLESIPGFNVDLDITTMHKALHQVGCFISAATSQICPADKIMYRIRDITSTVDYLNLMVASIISKKVASGTKFLVVDVKVGKAAFCKNLDSGRSLAKQLIKVSAALGVTTRVVLSHMDCPLGLMAGNALEVIESIQCLKGNMPSDIAELISVLGCNLLEMTGYKGNPQELIDKVITNGTALNKFYDMLAIQGVKEETIHGLVSGKSVLPSANNMTQFKACRSGWVSAVDALTVAQVVLTLGAGRQGGDMPIDQRVGTELHCHVGEYVTAGQPWLTVHHSTPSLPDNNGLSLQQAITIQPALVTPSNIVIEIVQ